MNILNYRKTLFFLSVICFISTACATTGSDTKRRSNWQAPSRFTVESVFDAALKVLSQSDLEIVSHDRQTGIISARRIIPIALTSIRSQVPLSVVISKTENRIILRTTAYLKGMGTKSAYEQIIRDFYDELFLELNINKSDEQAITFITK